MKGKRIMRFVGNRPEPELTLYDKPRYFLSVDWASGPDRSVVLPVEVVKYLQSLQVLNNLVTGPPK